MNSTEFTYWLQGFVELTETSTISEKQWQIIKDHLKLVFDKQTPNRNTEFKPNITVSDKLSPIDYKKITDLIGKEYNFPYYSPNISTITC